MTRQFSVGAVEAMAKALYRIDHDANVPDDDVSRARAILEDLPDGWELVKYTWTDDRKLDLDGKPWCPSGFAQRYHGVCCDCEPEPEHEHHWDSAYHHDTLWRIRCSGCDKTPYDVLLERRMQ